MCCALQCWRPTRASGEALESHDNSPKQVTGQAADNSTPSTDDLGAPGASVREAPPASQLRLTYATQRKWSGGVLQTVLTIARFGD